ncbi:MAG: hypothetical protein KDJ75_04860 [Alphaproteobacteria bacterium]|nr:hypothetical protein [Alphaproteobacteria bacterium]
MAPQNPAMYVENGALCFNGKALPDHLYDPNNFTLAAYKEQIQTLLDAGYEPVQYDTEEQHEKSVILRHDVAFSPSQALKMAKIEQELGVQSTFFFNFDSGFYTVNDQKVQDTIREIQAMGHQIGIQIKPEDKDGNLLVDEDLVRHIEEQKNIFEATLGANVECVSFDVTKLTPMGKIPQQAQIAGMLNTYGHKFADGVDRSKGQAGNSNGMHLYGTSMTDHVEQGTPHLHLLVYPDWLSDAPMLPHMRLLALPEVQKNQERYYSQTLKNAHETGRCVAGDGHFPAVDEQVRTVMASNPAYEPPLRKGHRSPQMDLDLSQD